MKNFRNEYGGKDRTQANPVAVTLDQAEVNKLVERAASGDVEAFGELYSIYLDSIYRYVFYQVRDKMIAEDITEEVFVKAWKAIGSCRGKEQKFLPWLYTIARNHTVDTFRSRKRELLVEMESVAEVGDHGLEMEKNLEQQQLLGVVAELPQNQKQVITLKFIEGLDNQEIGQVMHKNQGAIRVLQMRAIANIRQKLGGER